MQQYVQLLRHFTSDSKKGEREWTLVAVTREGRYKAYNMQKCNFVLMYFQAASRLFAKIYITQPHFSQHWGIVLKIHYHSRT